MEYILIHPNEFRNIIREELNNVLKASPTQENPVTFHTREETAKKLNISLVSLAKYTKLGFIKSNRIGGRVLYDLQEVKDSINKLNGRR